MAKLRTIHRCTECGATAPKWAGRCGACGAWNSLVEDVEDMSAVLPVPLLAASRPLPIAEVDAAVLATRPTGIGELDRVLGGGLVAGSVTLVGGEPGIGKSTLLLQAMASLARQGSRRLLVSAEESAQQVRLRAVKHRFGPTGELGLFEMTDAGLTGVPDPSGLFLGDRRRETSGSVVVPTMEGSRPLLVELQALVVPTELVNPRRSTSGIDSNRLALLAAVLHQRVGISLAKHEIYASSVGGVRVAEPGADLALGLALASSHAGVALPTDIVACGAVGLGGELRQVGHTARRLAEAARLGFRRAIVPVSAPDPPAGLQVSRVASVADAIAGLRLL